MIRHRMRFRYVDDPHPHLAIDEVVQPDHYARLTFPDALVAADAEWGITTGDPAYEQVMADPGWSALRAELTGAPFVHSVLDAFAADMRRSGCLVDADRARLSPFVESRDEKQLRVLSDTADPHEVFTRLDFQSKGQGGYRDFVHLDWPRRIVGGILFFSDAAEEGLDGGELALYRDRAFRNDRWCHDPERTAAFAPRHNTGVIFLNSNTGFHGPTAIRRLRGRRRWLYFTISSRVDVWPAAERAA
jgi:hypothetical protein